MTDRIRTVDMSDPAVVLDCYRKLNIAYKELKADNEKLRAEAFEQCAAMIDGFRIGLGGEQPALERIAEIIRHEAKCMLETDG